MFGRGAAMAARRIRSLWMQGRFIPAARGTRFIRKFPRTEPIFEANAQNKSIAIDRHSDALSFCRVRQPQKSYELRSNDVRKRQQPATGCTPGGVGQPRSGLVIRRRILLMIFPAG